MTAVVRGPSENHPSAVPGSSVRPTTREPRTGRVAVMRTWTATTITAARPAEVLDVLTDPQACRRWAPIPFELEEFDGNRLYAGAKAKVCGRLAGRSVDFDVVVAEADERG